MVEHPTLMVDDDLVGAILDGRKTQTRQVVGDGNSRGNFRASELLLDDPLTFADPGPSPAGNPGLYLHAPLDCRTICERRGWEPEDCDPTIVERLYPRWCPGDRLWVRGALSLEVTEIRVQRLQEISDTDALAEGVDRTNTSIPGYAKQQFARLWDSIYAERGYPWASNLWVWAITFRQEENDE